MWHQNPSISSQWTIMTMKDRVVVMVHVLMIPEYYTIDMGNIARI